MALWQASYRLVPLEFSVEEMDPEAPWVSADPPEGIVDIAAHTLALPPSPLSWAQDARHWGRDDSHDMTAWYEGGQLQSVQARLDLRADDWPEVASRLAAAGLQLGAIFQREDGAQVFPDSADLIEDIRSSEAFAFVQDPIGVLSRKRPTDTHS